MNTKASVMLVSQTRVKPDKNQEFETWYKKVIEAVLLFPGYVDQEVRRPNPPQQLDWIIIQYFVSVDCAKAWLQSKERQSLCNEIIPCLVGIDTVYIMQEDDHHQATTTASIATKVDAKSEQKFLHWQARIAPLQSKFPGFLGYTLERPHAGPGTQNIWIARVTFDSDEHLEAWLKSPERLSLLDELNEFSPESHIETLHEGFGFWFAQGKQRLVWKENMLVLLTLYPVVFLLSFVQGPLVSRGLPFWLALFFSNAISTIILGSLTVPWLMKVFDWWLNPTTHIRKYTILGIAIVLGLYGLTMGLCWWLNMYR